MCLGFLFPRSEILFLRQICILKAFSHCSIFIALEYYNMENIWKSSGVYKKTGSTKMAMVRIFTSRGHLSVKKQSSCAEVGFTQVCRKRKNNGWATLFFFLCQLFCIILAFLSPKRLFNSGMNICRNFSFFPSQLRHDDVNTLYVAQYKEH